MNQPVFQLLSRVASYYHHTLANSPKARERLAALGVSDAALLERFSIGHVDGTLVNVMPRKGEVAEQLKSVGILDGEGKEKLIGSFSIPVTNDQGQAVQVAFIQEDGTVSWLVDENRGWWNGSCLKHARDVRIVPDPLQGLLRLHKGETGVIAPAGPSATLDREARDLLQLHRPQLRIESDDAQWVQALADQIRELGLEAVNGGSQGGEKIVEQDANGFTVEFSHHLRFIVQGLVQDSLRHLRASIKVLGRAQVNGSARIHLDTLDLYHAKSRLNFARTAAVLLGEDPTALEECVTRLVAISEEFLRAQQGPTQAVVLTEVDKNEALSLLRDPNLMKRVLADLALLGYVGEESNKLISYVASVSRKMEDPLSVLIVSRSGAGKSTLAEMVMQLCPPEDLLRLTRLTGQSLFYQKANALLHKLIVIEEESGVQQAAYALRVLQSAGRLSLSTAAGYGTSTVREVKGPASIFVTTTKTNLDEETAGRFLTITSDESIEQTRRILEAQRIAETRPTWGRDRVVRVHQNAQRLLQTLPIVNPFAPKLSFPHHRLSARRDHKKYLALIRAMALLHQHQRKTVEGSIVVELGDIQAANRLANDALGQSLYDLTPPSRRLIFEIREWLKEQGKEEEKPFSQRELRDKVGWRKSQLAEHVRELVQAEYLVVRHESGPGRKVRYQLDWDGQGMDGERFFQGLTPTTSLEQANTSGSVPGHFRKTSGKAKPRATADSTAPVKDSGSEKAV